MRSIMKSGVLFLLIPCVVGALALSVSSAGADSRTYQRKMIQGYAVTGHNHILGKPYFTWGEPYGPFNFPTMGIYNEGGGAPLPIDEDTPPDAILATAVDPRLLLVTGKSADYVVPTDWINVPLRDVPVNTDFAFVNTQKLPGVEDAEPLQVAQAEPSQPLTLGQWMAATGVANIVCRGDMATVELKLRNLIPNRMYAVWATLGLPKDGSASTFFPIPLGGAPNVLVTDGDGDAAYERKVNFCPLDADSTNRPLLTINVQYHGNHQNYGAVPEPAFIDGNWLGLITFNHVQFPINVELLEQ